MNQGPADCYSTINVHADLSSWARGLKFGRGLHQHPNFASGVDPGFLEMGFLCKKCGGPFADFISFSQISHENEIIWSH